jgi:hypothetical protein
MSRAQRAAFHPIAAAQVRRRAARRSASQCPLVGRVVSRTEQPPHTCSSPLAPMPPPERGVANRLRASLADHCVIAPARLALHLVNRTNCATRYLWGCDASKKITPMIRIRPAAIERNARRCWRCRGVALKWLITSGPACSSEAVAMAIPAL